MGIVEEVGSQVQTLKKGQRVVIPFNISCGHCHFCLNHMESQCDESNPDQLYGGLFGFGKLNGNHWGGQAEYLRVPYADSTSFVVPDNDLPDEKVLFLSDILPTAYWSVENAGVKRRYSCDSRFWSSRSIRSKIRCYGWSRARNRSRSSTAPSR